jgi:hypothetical protein
MLWIQLPLILTFGRFGVNATYLDSITVDDDSGSTEDDDSDELPQGGSYDIIIQNLLTR